MKKIGLNRILDRFLLVLKIMLEQIFHLLTYLCCL